MITYGSNSSRTEILDGIFLAMFAMLAVGAIMAAALPSRRPGASVPVPAGALYGVWMRSALSTMR